MKRPFFEFDTGTVFPLRPPQIHWIFNRPRVEIMAHLTHVSVFAAELSLAFDNSEAVLFNPSQVRPLRLTESKLLFHRLQRSYPFFKPSLIWSAEVP